MVLPILARGAGIVAKTSRVSTGARMARNITGRRRGGNQPPRGGDQGAERDVSSLMVRPKTTMVPKSTLVTPKTFPVSSTSTSAKTGDKLTGIQDNLIEIDKILKGTLAEQKNQEDLKRKSEKSDKRSKLENNLENKNQILGKLGKKKLPKLPTPRLGFLGWIQNFIGSLILAYAITNFSGLLPQLAKLLPVILGVMDFAIDLGGKFLNAIVSFIDIGYQAYDWTRNTLKTFGGDALVAGFDKFMGAVDFIITALTLAAFARGFGGGPGPGGGRRGGPRGRGPRGRVPITRSGGVRTPRGPLGKVFRFFRFNPFTGARNPFRQRPRVTGGGSRFRNPFRTRPPITGGGPRPRIPKIPTGGGGILRRIGRFLRPLGRFVPFLFPLIEILFGKMEYDSRKEQGQTDVQAAAGTGGGIAGSIIAMATAAALIPEPTSTVGGLAVLGLMGLLGMGGSMAGSAIADKATGADQVVPPGIDENEVGEFDEGGEIKKKKKITPSRSLSTRLTTKRVLPKKPSSTRPIPAPPPPVKKGEPTPRAWWDFLGWFTGGGNTGELDLGPSGSKLGAKIASVGNTLARNDYFGPILQLTSKIILERKIEDVDYKNAGLGINMLIAEGVSKEKIKRGIKGFAEGGRIDGQLGDMDVSSLVAKTLKDSLKTELAKTYDIGTSKSASGGSTSTPGTSTTTSGGFSPSSSSAVFGTTEQKRMLDTISWAEGTGKGYGVVYGGGVSPELAAGKMTISEVLDFMNTSSLYARDGYNSDATGRYQFMSYTLKEEAKAQGIPLDTLWTPELQDKMILSRISSMRGVTAEMLKKEGMSDNVIDRLAPEFASFPNLIGPDAQGRVGTKTSYYGQGGKTAKDIKSYYGQATGEGSKIEIAQPSTEPSGNISPSISSGTGGNYERSAKGTKLAGDLGRYIYKTLTPAAKAADGVGDFSYASEHPDFGGSFKRSYNSWHNVDRAIDIGGYWPQDQKKILAKVMEFNQKFGATPVELLYGKPGTPKAGTHGDHVHVAYEKGGMTHDGPHLALIGEKGSEIVIDNDSSVDEVAPMLLAINAAKDKKGVMEAIKNYAPYESVGGTAVIINKQSVMKQIMASQGGSSTVVVAGAIQENFSEFLEYQG
tara:strand:- start:8394 stop:11744 length:3351 start_codon:yes stop_codon:yes gene_type:complete